MKKDLDISNCKLLKTQFDTYVSIEDLKELFNIINNSDNDIYSDDSITIDMVRNKMSSVCLVIELFEDNRVVDDQLKSQILETSKKAMNYICDGEVYKLK